MVKDLIIEDMLADDLGQDFDILLERSSSRAQISAGDIVKGQLTKFEKDGALVDVGFKSEGFLPSKEVINREDNRTLSEVLEFGKEYEFFVMRELSDKSPLLLSYKRVAQARGWVRLEEAKNKDEIIEAEVISTVKGGVIVEIYGVRGFVPASQLRRGQNEASKDAKIKVKIIELNKNSRKLICSQKIVVDQERAVLREKALQELEVGQIVEGKVVRVAEFGAFIDIGGIDGLLPVSEISWQRINHPKEKLKVSDETIQVKILKIDEAGKVSLSLKRLEPDPWTEIGDRFIEDQIVKGRVVKLTNFGAFVEIFPGVEGLLPSSEISEMDEDASPEKYLEVNQEVEVVIKRLSPYERRILLSMRGIEQSV